jgi:WD40 repeat protein
MRYEGNSDYTLWVASSDGTGVKQLFDPGDWSLESPTLCEWSPDGSILISGGVRDTYSLYHISEGGDHSKEKLSPETGYPLSGSLASDGRLLYSDGSEAVYIRAPGAPSDLLVTAHGSSAAWTPDGRFVVAISSEGDDALLVYQAPPGGATKLVRKIKMTLPPRGETAQAAIENLSVSPDGRWIVFDGADCMVEREVAWPCPYSLWVVGIDGKGLRKLAAGSSPSWGR